MDTDPTENENSHPKQQIEHAAVICRAKALPTGELYLQFEGQFFPSLPNVYFGLQLTRGTTKEQADLLATQITQHCPAMFARSIIDGDMDGLQHYETDPKTGLAKLD